MREIFRARLLYNTPELWSWFLMFHPLPELAIESSLFNNKLQGEDERDCGKDGKRLKRKPRLCRDMSAGLLERKARPRRQEG